MSDVGPKPKMLWLPVDKLTVDPKYQRDTGSRRSKNVIEKIALNFKWGRFGVVLVVKQKDGWHVIDGQHRVEACKLRGGIKTVPCLELPHATVAEAAADFVAINRDRVAVTPLHIHHAQLAAGDPEAIAVDQACSAAGVTICRYPVPLDKLKKGETLAVGAITRIVKTYGEDAAVRVLKTVRKNGGDAIGCLNAVAIRDVVRSLGIAETRSYMKPVADLSKGKTRFCLSCRKPFPSTGPNHRICDSCKGTSTYRGAALD
jgi:hypothetical protein